MKVMAFSARPDEAAFYDCYEKALGLELTRCKDGLSLENVNQTRGMDGVSCVGTCDLSAPVLEKLAENGVHYAALRTIGFDNVDLEAAERLGIRISHAAYSPYSVANYTVMLMLMCIRKAVYIMFRSHTADCSLGMARGMEMQNLTVGVIGTGRIGRAVIDNLSGFGCRIIASDPYPAADLKDRVEYVPLDELYARADIITLHTFLNDETYHMIDAGSIAKMKPGVVLINCARGALIDTRALIDECAAEAAEFAKGVASESIEKDKQICLDAGCEIVTFNDEDLATLRENAQIVYDMVKEDLGAETVQLFQDAIDAAR